LKRRKDDISDGATTRLFGNDHFGWKTRRLKRTVAGTNALNKPNGISKQSIFTTLTVVARPQRRWFRGARNG